MTDRDVIITSSGEKSSGLGPVVAAIIVVLGIIFAVWYFSANNAGDQGGTGVTVEVTTPEVTTETTTGY